MTAMKMDNWRDAGWSVVCRSGSTELEISVAQIQGEEWMLQIRPSRVPGSISSLFGSRPSATPDDVHSLALDVHAALSELELLGRPLWRWDGFPEGGDSTPERTGKLMATRGIGDEQAGRIIKSWSLATRPLTPDPSPPRGEGSG